MQVLTNLVNYLQLVEFLKLMKQTEQHITYNQQQFKSTQMSIIFLALPKLFFYYICGFTHTHTHTSQRKMHVLPFVFLYVWQFQHTNILKRTQQQQYN